VLGELLHSLSQPLTGLLCSLELSLQLRPDLSIEQVAEQQQASVSVALQQTERVIGMIQLMREYLDAEQPAPETFSSALASATRSVIEELSSIAAVRGVRLRLVGTCTATVPVPESRLRLALQYLITALIEAEPVGGKVTLLLGEGPAGAVLRAEGERDFQQQKPSTTSPQTTLRRARIAIASRVLESVGASVVFAGGDVDPAGFVLRIPRRVVARD
jgi:signal transduction histidine kinase